MFHKTIFLSSSQVAQTIYVLFYDIQDYHVLTLIFRVTLTQQRNTDNSQHSQPNDSNNVKSQYKSYINSTIDNKYHEVKNGPIVHLTEKYTDKCNDNSTIQLIIIDT